VPKFGRQAKLSNSGTKIIDALRAVERADGFQLHRDRILHQQVGKLFGNDRATVSHHYAGLLHDREVRVPQFDRQGIIVRFLWKVAAERVGHLEAATDHSLRYRIKHRRIRVHRRSFAFICV